MPERTVTAAFYGRTSSDLQRERQTIQGQLDALQRYLSEHPEVRLYRRYLDDGVTGELSVAERPGSIELLRDAAAGRFTQVLVTKADRLGRDKIDLLLVRRRLADFGVRLVGIHENIDDELSYDLRAIVADYERRQTLERSRHGMETRARAGQYLGGVCPLGYRVDGDPPRIVPDDRVVWGDWTAVELVRRIYRWLAIDGRSCRWIAKELNRLGVPTAYEISGRGVRGVNVQGEWRAGRIRNLVVNSVYRGELQFGRRPKKMRQPQVVSGRVEPLVSDELWHGAQRTLRENRIMPKNSRRRYLLRSVIVCGLCGLHYTGSVNRGKVWYRCDGQLVERGPLPGRCPGKSVAGPDLEPLVWADVESFLRDPGDLIRELEAERELSGAAAVAEAERTTLQKQLENLEARRERLLDALEQGRVQPSDVDGRLARIDDEKRQVAQKLAEAEAEARQATEQLAPPDLLEELHRRLDEGLDDVQRNEIVKLLVPRIVIHTTELENGKKAARAVVQYRFPQGVVTTRTGRGSSRRRA